MSMNIHLEAHTEAILKNGQTYKINEHFTCWQTPTKITYQILKSPNKVQAYSDWVNSHDNTETFPNFMPEDALNPDRQPISYTTIDYGQEHLKALQEWLDAHPSDVWTLEWYDM